MKIGTLASLVTSGQLRTARATIGLFTPLYRAAWLIGGARGGVLSALAEGPLDLDDLVERLGVGDEGKEALAAWLQVGVSLGELSHRSTGYSAASLLARRLGAPEHDPSLAMLEEGLDLHRKLLAETPSRLRAGRPFTLADQDGEIVARSSRLAEPFIHDAISDFVPQTGPAALLEIGCGSGTHIRHAASCNPELTGLGVDLQEDVVGMARRNLQDWGLSDRFRVEAGDIREREVSPEWDLATLHQNIYYFPVPTRIELLRHVRGFLKPGGRLMLTTACRGGSSLVDVLDLWGAATEGAGRLPAPDELVEQLEAAGFVGVKARRLMPGESFFSFVGRSPDAR